MTPKHSRNLLHVMRIQAADEEFERRIRNGTWELSDRRAKICVVNHDAISAGLWALAGFDTALVHFAELRERCSHLPEDDQRRISLDRALSVYLEGQCSELLRGAGITRHDADDAIDTHLGDTSPVALHVTACTDDPLAMETFGYALYLGVLTAHGTAPWNRFAAVMADCYHEKHPVLAVK